MAIIAETWCNILGLGRRMSILESNDVVMVLYKYWRWNFNKNVQVSKWDIHMFRCFYWMEVVVNQHFMRELDFWGKVAGKKFDLVLVLCYYVIGISKGMGICSFWIDVFYVRALLYFLILFIYVIIWWLWRKWIFLKILIKKLLSWIFRASNERHIFMWILDIHQANLIFE